MRNVLVLFFIFLFLPLSVSAEVFSAVVTEATEPRYFEMEGIGVESFEQDVTVDSERGEVTFKNDFVPLDKGQKIFVDQFTDEDGEVFTSLYDVDRRGPIIFVFGIFAALVLLLHFRKGLKSLASLLITGIVVLFVLIPALKAGYSPVLVGSTIAIFLLACVMLFTHGLNKKTLVAMMGTAAAILTTVILTLIVLSWGRFTGIGTDESFAVIASGIVIDMPQLLFVGILIGMLGVLDDVAITQASVVQQLRNAGKSGRELFVSAMRVGQDHVGALVNTLVLAYTGAALPLVLLTTLKVESLPTILSIEVVATEIIRAFLGSIGVILTVPLTTALAVIILKRNAENVDPHEIHHHH